VPEDGFFDAAGAAVVQVVVVRCAGLVLDLARGRAGHAHADKPMPQSGVVRHSAARGFAFAEVVGQAWAHVVQQEVRERMNGLVAKLG